MWQTQGSAVPEPMWLIGWDTRAHVVKGVALNLRAALIVDPRISGPRAHVGNGVGTELEPRSVADPRISGSRANVVDWVGHQSPCG